MVPRRGIDSEDVGTQEVAILVGLPGAGKSTFYRQRLAGSHVLVSKDLLRTSRHAGRRQLELVAAALAEGRSVAVDNTNPRREDRAPLVELARRHGARAVAYFFPTDTRGSLERNSARQGRARVPAVAIFVAARRMQPPTRAEGLDAVYRVDLLPGGGFGVRPDEAVTPP